MPTLEISSLAHGGHGVARLDGAVWFIPYTLPGDVVEASPTRAARGVIWGTVQRVLSPSPHRTESPCAHFGACGGCTWLHFAYPAQLEWKTTIVRETLRRLGGLEPERIESLEDPALRLGYRTRAEFHADQGRRGFYALGSRNVVDVAHCALCHPKLNEALSRLRAVRHPGGVEITVNPDTDEVLVWAQRAGRALKTAFPSVQSGDVDARNQFMFDGVPIVNGAFSQSSLLLNRLLRRVVAEWLPDTGDVLDIYCGSGNFSLAHRGNVLGFDHNRAAIRAANAVRQDSYRVGDDSAIAKAALGRRWDAIILDPPRTGAKALMSHLAKADAARIVYVSCDPATLARDLKMLIGGGWRLEQLAVVDMFPHTAHVESVALLKR